MKPKISKICSHDLYLQLRRAGRISQQTIIQMHVGWKQLTKGRRILGTKLQVSAIDFNRKFLKNWDIVEHTFLKFQIALNKYSRKKKIHKSPVLRYSENVYNFKNKTFFFPDILDTETLSPWFQTSRLNTEKTCRHHLCISKYSNVWHHWVIATVCVGVFFSRRTGITSQNRVQIVVFWEQR